MVGGRSVQVQAGGCGDAASELSVLYPIFFPLLKCLIHSLLQVTEKEISHKRAQVELLLREIMQRAGDGRGNRAPRSQKGS